MSYLTFPFLQGVEITVTPDQDHTDFTKGLTLLVDAIGQKKVITSKSVFQLENEKGRAPGRALCAKWAREGTF